MRFSPLASSRARLREVPAPSAVSPARVGRHSVVRDKVMPFGHVLVGGVRVGATVTSSGPRFNNTKSISETDFAVQAGGGVNVLMTRTMGFRMGADYLRIFPKKEGASGPEGINVFRFAAGLVLSLSTK